MFRYVRFVGYILRRVYSRRQRRVDFINLLCTYSLHKFIDSSLSFNIILLTPWVRNGCVWVLRVRIIKAARQKHEDLSKSMCIQMMDFKSRISRLKKSRPFTYGLPFLLLVIGGSFGLREFTELRYKYRPVKTLVREDMAALGFEMKKPEETTLEAQYEKVKQMDIDHWKNVRIPRPWEEDGKEI